MTTALIAEDEPVLAAEIQEALASLWPELEIAHVVHDGIAAMRALDAGAPDVLFLDVRMPGLDGIDVARLAGARCHVVFITAYDRYATQAFTAGAVDYLLKPIEMARLAETVRRVRERLRYAASTAGFAALSSRGPVEESLQWITALQGRDIHFIPIDEVCYFRADHKYVTVVTPALEALITTPLKELVRRLDPTVFRPIRRGVVVNLHAVHSVRRTIAGHLDLRLRTRPETLRVSAGHAQLFKHM